MYVYTYIYIRTYLFIYVYVHVHTFTYVYKYVRTHIRQYVGTYVHTYVRAYRHTYIHTHPDRPCKALMKQAGPLLRTIRMAACCSQFVAAVRGESCRGLLHSHPLYCFAAAHMVTCRSRVLLTGSHKYGYNTLKRPFSRVGQVVTAFPIEL